MTAGGGPGSDGEGPLIAASTASFLSMAELMPAMHCSYRATTSHFCSSVSFIAACTADATMDRVWRQGQSTETASKCILEGSPS